LDLRGEWEGSEKEGKGNDHPKKKFWGRKHHWGKQENGRASERAGTQLHWSRQSRKKKKKERSFRNADLYNENLITPRRGEKIHGKKQTGGWNGGDAIPEVLKKKGKQEEAITGN